MTKCWIETFFEEQEMKQWFLTVSVDSLPAANISRRGKTQIEVVQLIVEVDH